LPEVPINIRSERRVVASARVTTDHNDKSPNSFYLGMTMKRIEDENIHVGSNLKD
jgi:hypothetical protein